MAREDLLARTLVQLADTLTDDFDLVELSQLLVERCVGLFDASAAGLLLADAQDRLRLMAYSSAESRLLELFEVQAREGPSLDVYRSGLPVINQDLTALSGRWPGLVEVALASGFRSMHSLPVRLRGRVIGALNLLRSDVGLLGDADALAAQALADMAAIAILQHRALHDAQLLADQLQTALFNRIVVEQAKGMVAQHAGVTVDQAFERLRAYSRNNHRQLTGVCQAIIAGTFSIDAIVATGSPS